MCHSCPIFGYESKVQRREEGFENVEWRENERNEFENRLTIWKPIYIQLISFTLQNNLHE